MRNLQIHIRIGSLFLILLIFKLPLPITSGQEPEFEVFSAENIQRIEQIATIPRGEIIRTYPESGHIVIEEEDTYQLWDLVTGELLESVTPDDPEIWSREVRRGLFPEQINPEMSVFERYDENLTMLVNAPEIYVEPYNLVAMNEFSPDGEHLVMWATTAWNAEQKGTMVQIIGREGDVQQFEHPHMIYDIVWSPDGTRFVGYADGVWPGEMSAVFTLEDGSVKILEHDFPADEDYYGVEQVFWLDDDRILTVVGFWSEAREIAMWDANTGERITTILPYDDEIWRVAIYPDQELILRYDADQIRIEDMYGELINAFPRGTLANLQMVADYSRIVDFTRDGRYMSVLDLSGAIIGALDIEIVPFTEDIYQGWQRAFNADQTLMVSPFGDDCTQTDRTLYLWDFTDISEPLAEMTYHGFLRGLGFVGDETLFYAALRPSDGLSRPCDLYADVEKKTVFWNLQGEVIKTLEGEDSFRFVLNDRLLLRYFPERIEVWGVPLG